MEAVAHAEEPAGQGQPAVSNGATTPFTSSAAVQLSSSFSKSGRRLTAGAGGHYETPLPWLHGTWRGKGKGVYPTIKSFEYHEELCIQGNPSNPRPVLGYRQRTWSKHANPKPMHEEQGWIRVLPPTDPDDKGGCQRVEVVGAAQNGTCTIEEGFVRDQHTLVLRSTSMARSSTSRNPYAVEFIRTFEVDVTSDPPTMHYTMDMSTTTTPAMTRHLEAWLVKLHEVSVSPSPTMLYATPSGAASPVSIAHQHSMAGAVSVLRSESSAGLLPPAGASLQHLLSSSPAAVHAPHHLAAHHHAAGLPPRPSSNLGLSTTHSNGTVVPLSPSLSSSGASLVQPHHHHHQPHHLHAHHHVAASAAVTTPGGSPAHAMSNGHAAVSAASLPSTPPPVAPVLAGTSQHDPLSIMPNAQPPLHACAAAAGLHATMPHHLASMQYGTGASGSPSSSASTPLPGVLGGSAVAAEGRVNGAGPHPASLDLALRGLMLQAQASPGPSGSVSRENLMVQGLGLAEPGADEANGHGGVEAHHVQAQVQAVGLRAPSPAVGSAGVCPVRSRLAVGAIATACPLVAGGGALPSMGSEGDVPAAPPSEDRGGELERGVRVCPAFAH